MFTKRHEQDLAEIKALTYELGQRFQDVLEQLEQIQEAQGRLANADRSGAPVASEPASAVEPEPSSTPGPQVEVATPSSTAAGAKKARRRQSRSATAVADGAKQGKRRGNGKGARAGARKRSQAETPGSDED